MEPKDQLTFRYTRRLHCDRLVYGKDAFPIQCVYKRSLAEAVTYIGINAVIGIIFGGIIAQFFL